MRFASAVFLLCSLTISNAFAQMNCLDLFTFESAGVLSSGQQVVVAPIENIAGKEDSVPWNAGEEKSLVFVGKLRGGGDGGGGLIFSDAQLNVYYFGGSTITINGSSGYFFDIENSASLPSLIRQTPGEGSCQLCSSLMATNQHLYQAGLPEISTTGKQAETNGTYNSVSYHQQVRSVLTYVYNEAWPSGYVQGAKPAVSMLATIPRIKKYMAELQLANNKILAEAANLENKSATTKPSAIVMTKSAEEFMRHMRNGGTAIVAGSSDWGPTRETITSNGTGVMSPYSDLSPYKKPGFFANLKRLWAASYAQTEVLEAIFEGKVPSEELIAKFAFSAPTLGHAIAAVGIIKSGPLNDHIIMLNPWGTIEIYDPADIKDNMTYSLIPN